MTLPESLTLEQARALSTSNEFINPHGIDIRQVFEDLSREEPMFHVSRKVVEIPVEKGGKKDMVRFLDTGVTYRRSEPKPLSRKARRRLANSATS